MSEDLGQHGRRTVRSDGSVHFPDEALDAAGIEPGDDVHIFSTDKQLVVQRWTDEEIEEEFRGE